MPDSSPHQTAWLARVSLDTWAVLLAFAAALLVRAGVITKVAW